MFKSKTIIAKKRFLLYVNCVDNNVLDYDSILKDCGVGTMSTQAVIQNIVNLEEFYDRSDLVNIYNYCLSNICSAEILIQIIKLSDLYRATSTLTILTEILKQTTQDDDENTVNLRALCAKAISNYKDASSVTILLDCLNNKKEHYKVRLACADALGRIGDRFAVKPLIDIVEDEEEKSIYIKESATFALGLLGDVRAIEPLISILESKQGFLDKFTFLKEKVIEALGKLNINNERVMKALKKTLMDSSPIIRINAIEAIMNSNSDNAVELIKPSLHDDDDEVKKNALIALYNLIGRDILDEVMQLPIYGEFLRREAKELFEEYECEDNNEE